MRRKRDKKGGQGEGGRRGGRKEGKGVMEKIMKKSLFTIPLHIDSQMSLTTTTQFIATESRFRYLVLWLFCISTITIFASMCIRPFEVFQLSLLQMHYLCPKCAQSTCLWFSLKRTEPSPKPKCLAAFPAGSFSQCAGSNFPTPIPLL